MFDYIEQDEPILRSLLPQQFIAPACGFFLAAPFGSQLGAILPPTRFTLSACYFVGAAIAGFATGYAAVRLWRNAYRMAQWVWLAPAALFLLVLFLDIKRGANFFITALYVGSDAPELGLGPYLCTYPLLSSICYAIGSRLAFIKGLESNGSGH